MEVYCCGLLRRWRAPTPAPQPTPVHVPDTEGDVDEEPAGATAPAPPPPPPVPVPVPAPLVPVMDASPYDSERECEWDSPVPVVASLGSSGGWLCAGGEIPEGEGDWSRETPRTLLPLLIRVLLQSENPGLAVPERGWGRVCDVESTTLDVRVPGMRER